MYCMTTTRRRAKAPAQKNDRDETLDEFSAAVDEHIGHPVGFADTVRRLHATRTQLYDLKAKRAAVHEHLRSAYDLGHRVVGATGLELYQTQPGEPRAVREVPSAVVKKADKKAYEAARVVVQRVSVKAPDRVKVKLIEAPDGGGFMPPVDAVLAYRDPVWRSLKWLAEQEQEMKDALAKIAANAGWDGGVEDGPLVTSDGWSVQVNTRRYDSEALRANDPALWEQLAVATVKQASPALRVRRYNPDGDGAEDDDEFGELDGD